MANIPIAKGKTLYVYGNPMTSIQLIVKGKVQVRYPGGRFLLNTGDVIGINEICSEIHFLEYYVQEDAELAVYPVHSMEALEEIFRGHPDVARLSLISAFKQIAVMMNESSLNGITCNDLYTSAREDAALYQEICRKHRVSSMLPPSYDELEAYLGDEAPDYWLNSFYTGLCKFYSSAAYQTLLADSSVTMGMLRKCSLDFRRTYIGVEEQARYIQKVRDFYLRQDKVDFVNCVTNLYRQLPTDDGDTDTLFQLMNRIFLQLENPNFSTGDWQERQKEFMELVTALESGRVEPAAQKQDNEKKQGQALDKSLMNSLTIILNFAEADVEYGARLRHLLTTYKNLPDKYSTEEECSQLRHSLTKDFYVLYHSLFFHSLEVGYDKVPEAVKLFLYFGYVDEELAGPELAMELLKLLPQVEALKDTGVYPFYQWLLAIYEGKKEPSRNEFEVDYAEQVQKMKLEYNLSQPEVNKLKNDRKAKVEYELKNLFPSVNKMTYGRISTYIPFFDKDNVLKGLASSLVNQEKVLQSIQMVREVDYSVFYRESLGTDPLMGKIPVHLEYLPDLILTPNVGVRAVMWQEIEGKVRTTPARFVISVFHQEDFLTSFIHLAAEFRWEMCKRIQGSRWNDITDPSLTSEYFDYIQFYRKNHELSSEAKEKVRTSLQRCKNSFKEMFIRDYMTWILYEGKGSMRLNKLARRILFLYCPFSKDITRTLVNNPQFAELIQRQEIKNKQQLHMLHNVRTKISNAGKKPSEVLEKEIAFYEKRSIG